jgi:hypothetical protein
VTVFDIVVDPPAVLIVMEYVDGTTLAEELKAAEGVEPARVLALLEPLASALDHLHANGVVHRDVKPANVLLGRKGVVKLTDLGIAHAAGYSPLTSTGVLLGTTSYIAPEQTRPGAPTPAADIYALAVIAYELLTGRRLRAGSTQAELLAQASRGAIPDLDEAWPDGNPRARAALRAGLAPEPEDRPPSAGAFVAGLREALHEPEPEPEPAPQPEPTREAPTVQRPAVARRPRRSRAPLLALAALVAVAVALGVLLTRDGDDPEPVTAHRSPTPTATTTAEPTEQATPAAPRANARERAVRQFYERAARDDFDGAWALAGPGMRAAFGNSIEQFSRDLGSLQSIEFRQLRADGNLVHVRTVATHTDRVDRCTGTLRTVRGPDGGWQVEPAGLSCN